MTTDALKLWQMDFRCRAISSLHGANESPSVLPCASLVWPTSTSPELLRETRDAAWSCTPLKLQVAGVLSRPIRVAPLPAPPAFKRPIAASVAFRVLAKGQCRDCADVEKTWKFWLLLPRMLLCRPSAAPRVPMPEFRARFDFFPVAIGPDTSPSGRRCERRHPENRGKLEVCSCGECDRMPTLTKVVD